MIVSLVPQMISAIIALITIRVYSEILTPEQLGGVMLALGLVALFDAILSSSISQVVFYFSSKPSSARSIYQLLRKYQIYTTKFAVILISIILSLEFYELQALFILKIILLIIFYIIIEPSRSGFLSLLNVVSSRRIYGLQVVLDSVFVISFSTIALLYQPDWMHLLIGVLSARFISLTVNKFFLERRFGKFDYKLTKLDLPFSGKEEVIKQIKPIMLMGVLGWISSFADRYIIAGTVGIASSGYYSIANGLVGKPYDVTTAAFTAHYRPAFYKHFSAKNKRAFNDVLKKWSVAAIATGILGMVLFLVLGEFAVKLLLSLEYRGKVENLLWILSAAFTCTILTHVFDNKFLAQGEGGRLFKIQLKLIPLPLIIIPVGAIVGGLIGAAIGKFISEFIKCFFTYLFSKKIKL